MDQDGKFWQGESWSPIGYIILGLFELEKITLSLPAGCHMESIFHEGSNMIGGGRLVQPSRIFCLDIARDQDPVILKFLNVVDDKVINNMMAKKGFSDDEQSPGESS